MTVDSDWYYDEPEPAVLENLSPFRSISTLRSKDGVRVDHREAEAFFSAIGPVAEVDTSDDHSVDAPSEMYALQLGSLERLGD